MKGTQENRVSAELNWSMTEKLRKPPYMPKVPNGYLQKCLDWVPNAMCRLCKGQRIIHWYCRTCSGYLCYKCFARHTFRNYLQSHEVQCVVPEDQTFTWTNGLSDQTEVRGPGIKYSLQSHEVQCVVLEDQSFTWTRGPWTEVRVSGIMYSLHTNEVQCVVPEDQSSNMTTQLSDWTEVRNPRYYV